MSPELDKALCDKYPKIFANRHGDMRNTAMCWGFACGDGWYNIIDTLCYLLQSMHDWNDKNPMFPQIVASQVKEKYGELRFYTEGATEWQSGAIEMATALSLRTCEECGQRGECNTTNGWMRTRCASHK